MPRLPDRGERDRRTPIGGPRGEPRLGIRTAREPETDGIRGELHARGVRFVKIWVDDRNGDVPKLQPGVYRASSPKRTADGMEVLAPSSNVSAGRRKGLLKVAWTGSCTWFAIGRGRRVSGRVKAHPKVWSGPNIPVPSTRDTIASLAETLPAKQIEGMRAQLAQLEAKGNPPNELFELHCRNLRKIHDVGMVIGMGTDGTGDGFGAHEQIEAYTRCGMTAWKPSSPRRESTRGSSPDRMGTIGRGRSRLQRARAPCGEHHQHGASAVYLRGKELDRQALGPRS